MPLTPGTRLGPDQIVAAIGAGGMGEVYRARDTKLQRDVAVKVLPPHLALDPEHHTRFEREAHTLAALSHPNILPIHDFGVSGGTAYAVMALLDGRTLRDWLDGGPIAIRRALEYGVAIASGLAAAHDRGIVHRDLKPENVFITSDGRVTLLDFGLAQTTAAFAAASEGSTILQTPTVPGTVLGTVGYMSPEQVRGADTDARTDIFSFGILLYEMVNGRRPFEGPSPVETMNAIVQAEPVWLPADGSPPALQRLIDRCLEKSPAARFQSASDLAFALQQISSPSTSGPTATLPQAPRHQARRLLWAGAAIAAALAAFAGGRWSAHPGDRSDALQFERLTFRPGNILDARFSPDGATVVYAASWEGAAPGLFTVRVDGGESRPLDLGNADLAAVSSKSELAIIRLPAHAPGGRGTLARLSLGGGAPRDLLEDVFAADWAPNRDDLAVVRRAPDGLQRLEYPIGHVLYTSASIRAMRMSPDGRRVGLIAEGQLLVLDASSGTVVLRRDWGTSGRAVDVAWAPSADALYVVAGPDDRESALRRVDLTGRERVLLEAAGVNLLLHDVAKNGDLLVERATSRRGILYHGPGDDRERDLSWLDGSQLRSLSDDGAWILFTETLHGAGPRGDVYIRKTDGALPIRLGDGHPLDLSRDGRWVLAISVQRPARLVMLPTGAGVPRTLDTGEFEPNGGVFTPDGARVVFGSEAGQGQMAFHTIDLQSGIVRPFTVAEGGAGSAFVRDRGVVFGDREMGTARLLPDGHIEAIAPDGSRRLVPGPPLPSDQNLVAWSADGAIYSVVEDTLPAELHRMDSRTGVRTPWRKLMPANPAGVTEIGPIVVARDGQSYAYSYRRVTSSDLFLVHAKR